MSGGECFKEDIMIILRKYTNCTEEEVKALVSTDISIACVDKRIATLKELLDSSLGKVCFNRIKELEGYKAKLYYEKLLFAFPKADAVYEDAIVSICGLSGLEALRSYGLIESCACVNGRKLYVI